MSHLFRKGDGEPIRAAMREANLSGPRLAKATRQVDPEGKGLSAAAIGRITGLGQTAQNKCRLRSAWLVADALGSPLQHLFSRMPAASTETVERSRSSHGDEDNGIEGGGTAAGTHPAPDADRA